MPPIFIWIKKLKIFYYKNNNGLILSFCVRALKYWDLLSTMKISNMSLGQILFYNE